MLASFKGKPVYLDLWATWCEPCKEEFKYSSSLYQELNKRNIQLLYVSLNTGVSDSSWNADIKSYKLAGYHAKANQALQDALATLIWGAPVGYSIPKYLLFDTNGKVLLSDALPPSSDKDLYKQIDATVNNK